MRSKRTRLFDTCKQQVDALMASLNEKFKAIKESEDDQAMVDFKSVLEATLAEATAIARKVKASITEKSEIGAMRTAIAEAQARINRRCFARKSADKLHIGSSLDTWEQRDDRLGAIRELEDFYPDIVEEMNLNLDALKAELEVALHGWFDPLWAVVQSSRDAFAELFVFVTGSGGYGTKHAGTYRDRGIDLDLSGWNDAVATHKQDPVYGDFIGLNPDLKPSEVLRMAVEAKLDNQPTAIKIVLAYCKYAKQHADAVGWVRQVLAEMAVLNDRAVQQ